MTTERPKKRATPRDELEQEYPTLTALAGPVAAAQRKAWVAVFNTRSDIMHNLLRDYIKQVHAVPGRIGQRPMPEEAQVDLEGLLYGQENDLPIGEALKRIVTDSERVFSAKIHMSRRTYQRLVLGDYDPDVNEMRMIARALKVPPTFFVEYRKAMVVAAVLNLLDERPGIATSLYRHYLEVRLKN